MLWGALFFLLVGAFFLAAIDQALKCLGRGVLPEGKRFFFLPFLRFVFSRGVWDRLVWATPLGWGVCTLGFGFVAAPLLLGIESGWAWGVGVGLLWLFLLVGIFLPRFGAGVAPLRWLGACGFGASCFLYLTFPLTFPFLWAKRREEDPLEEMREAIVEILQRAHVEGALGPSDRKLIESVVKFKDRIVREVMVPRVDLFSLPVSTSIREAARQLAEEGFSRTPVYRESVDNITGVLMFKDVLELYMDVEAGKKDRGLLDRSLETVVKSVFYTPETKKVSHLLQEFRTKQMHMAIVVDEYGGTEGVVTIEDILEEIVGEIADEYDVDEEMLYTAQPGGGSWVVDARMSIFDAEEIFGIQVPQEGEYDTIGGYIFHKVGAIPEKGLKIHHDDFDLEILKSTDRSVEKVRITPRRKGEEG